MKKITIISQATLALSAGLLFTACSTMHQDEPTYSSAGYSSDAYSSADQSQMSVPSQQRTSIEESSGAQTEGNLVNQLDIPLHEERVNVGKRNVDAGRVTIRKFVTTETVNQPVQLRRETLVIDREGGKSRQGFSTSQSQGSPEWQASSETEQRARLNASANIADEPAGAEIQSGQQYGASTSSSAQSSSTEWKSSSPSAAPSGAAFQEQSYTIRLQAEQPVIEKNVVQTGRVTARKNSETEQQNISQQIRREEVQLDRSGAPNVEIRGDLQAGRALDEPSGAERPSSSQKSQSFEIESSTSQDLNSGLNESTDSTTENRVPTQGQGAQDLKEQVEDQP